MSRTDDYGLTDSERREKSPSAFDRMAELPSRLGLSREAARVEMERFRGVAEYEIRKIFGQRSTLKQPFESAASPKPRRKKTDHEPAVVRKLKPSARQNPVCREEGSPVQSPKPRDEKQPAQTELEPHD
jgi:hypothetical protein